ncbi:MAG: helix-turn-helix domain-containing protein [Thermoplasmataceae archaeon]
MYRSYRTRIHPNEQQKIFIEKHAGSHVAL